MRVGRGSCTFPCSVFPDQGKNLYFHLEEKPLKMAGNGRQGSLTQPQQITHTAQHPWRKGSKENKSWAHKCFEILIGRFFKTETDELVFFVPKALIRGLAVQWQQIFF